MYAGDVDGVALCRMFNGAISTRGIRKYLSTDNDPLFTYHQWTGNLRILDIDELKSVPYTPRSHPFIERPTAIRPIVGRLPSITRFTPCMVTSFY